MFSTETLYQDLYPDSYKHQAADKFRPLAEDMPEPPAEHKPDHSRRKGCQPYEDARSQDSHLDEGEGQTGC